MKSKNKKGEKERKIIERDIKKKRKEIEKRKERKRRKMWLAENNFLVERFC
jgi:hypothetical protein